jgi:AcrR family transcriptional regulator
MTLYTHFKTKNELLDLTFERLLHRLAPPRHGSTWQAELEEVCRHMRSVLLEHPHWMALVTRVVAPPSALADYDRLLGLMRKDGFSPRAGMFAFSSAISLALGSVLVQRLMDGPHPIPLQRLTLIKGMLATMPRRRYPSIAAAAPRFDRWSFSGVFEIALHSLIAGLGEHGVRYGDGKRRRRRRAYTYRT